MCENGGWKPRTVKKKKKNGVFKVEMREQDRNRDQNSPTDMDV